MATIAEAMQKKCAEMIECVINGRGRAKGVGTETNPKGSSLNSITMTQATECIWGPSGKENPNAKKMIESVEAFGFFKIETVGRISRVSVTYAGYDLFYSNWRG